MPNYPRGDVWLFAEHSDCDALCSPACSSCVWCVWVGAAVDLVLDGNDEVMALFLAVTRPL